MYEVKHKVATYNQQHIESLGMGELLVKCLERMGQLITGCFGAMEAKNFTQVQINADKTNDLIDALCLSMGEGAQDKASPHAILLKYLQDMQATFGKAMIKQDPQAGEQVVASLQRMTQTLRETNKKILQAQHNEGQASAQTPPKPGPYAASSPQPRAQPMNISA